MGLAVAAASGMLLSYALVLTTRGAALGDSPLDEGVGGNVPAGVPVLTEDTLGAEVQRLIATGYVERPADFDVQRCLSQHGTDEPVLVLEQALWGPGTTLSWLIIHTPTAGPELQQKGGPVNVTVVLPSCGTAPAGSTVLWSGSTMIGPASS